MTSSGPHRQSERAHFIGGPDDGRHSIPIPDGLPTPPYICTTRNDGEWQHYVHVVDDGYLYVGPCAAAEHAQSAPHEHCRCGDVNCGGCP